MLDRSRIPVIVGVGQITDTESPPESARSPLGLMIDSARMAALDTGSDGEVLRDLDSVAVVRLFSDTAPRFRSPFGSMTNPPYSVARRLGAKPRDLVYSPQGGDIPQIMVARACDRIMMGESNAALIVGAEAMRTELAARRAGLELDWNEDAPNAPNELGGKTELYSQPETDHGMRSALAMYAFIEEAVRKQHGRSVSEHRRFMAELFSPLSRVAAHNPLAANRREYSADELEAPSRENRMVGSPYSRLLVASAYVDQAAAIIVCSEAKADEWGVALSRRVYLHGSASAHDHYFVSERPTLDRSDSLRSAGKAALEMAGLTTSDIALFDLYSCFPTAVEIACKELGLPIGDPRGVTVTGGLPYFGGPGNNYVTNAIAEMVTRLRAAAGSFGLVSGNGGLMTKQAIGVYSTQRPAAFAPFVDRNVDQSALDRRPSEELVMTPDGAAVIEVATVQYGKGGPVSCSLFGRQAVDGRRFLAVTPPDKALLEKLASQDLSGVSGVVRSNAGVNTFTPV